MNLDRYCRLGDRARWLRLTRAAVAAAVIGVAQIARASDAPTPERPDIAIGILPTADYVAVALAQQENFFREEGLNVTIRMTTTPTVVPALVGGELQAGGVNWFNFITAINRKIELRAVAEADRGTPGYTAFLVKASSDLHDIADLLGKKVAVVALNGNCDLLLDEALRLRGLDYTKVRYVTLGIPDMGPTLDRGGVDAACVPEPLLTVFSQQGGTRPIMDLFSGDHAGFPITSITVTADFAAKNPNTIAALQRALRKGEALANSHPEKARAVLTTYTTIKPELAEKLAMPAYPAVSEVAILKRPAELMERFHVLEPPIALPVLLNAP